MHLGIKLLWLCVTILGAVSLIWFLLGSTANFQRGIDLSRTVILIWVWLPTLIMVVVSIWMMLKGLNPNGTWGYVPFFAFLIVLILLSLVLFQNVNTQGWFTERVTSDSLKLTDDKKYEYRVDLINLFQRNSSARLFLRNVSTGEEMYIPVEIQTNQIHGIGIGEDNHWVLLESTNSPNRYILFTTNNLPIPIERFEIDVGNKTSRRLE